MNTAVAIIVFHRPDLTRSLLRVLAQVRPPRLYVIADGPRAHKAGESESVEEVRALIESEVTWACRVEKNYATKNLGCGKRIATGLDWVFAHEETAIVLEDDCMPDLSFFEFCETMLTRYRDEPRIMHVAGCNLDVSRPGADYFYSDYPLVWGWASWRRAWQTYDFKAKAWGDPEVRKRVKKRCFLREYGTWDYQFSLVRQPDRVDIWDFQWVLTCWLRSGLSIVPCKNLVSNLGFRDDATHTKQKPTRFKNETESLLPPYRAPATLAADRVGDRTIAAQYFMQSVPRYLLNLVRGK